MYTDFFSDFPEFVIIDETVDGTSMDFIHLFATTTNDLEDHLKRAIPCLKKNGMLWISWPKKTSSLYSEINANDVRKYGLETGLVDTKVASINLDWSGIKFMYRLKDR